jgi:uncharacterized protein
MNLSIRFLFGFLLLTFNLAGMPENSQAASYDIKEMTADVKTSLDNRRERFEQLRAFKEKGVIGENNRGYVEVLGGNGEVQALVTAENKDRRAIYTAIVKQNQLAESELSKVEQAFAQVQREKAAAGDKIQDPDGQWVTK